VFLVEERVLEGVLGCIMWKVKEGVALKLT
jgi:hypothetical protein